MASIHSQASAKIPRSKPAPGQVLGFKLSQESLLAGYEHTRGLRGLLSGIISTIVNLLGLMISLNLKVF